MSLDTYVQSRFADVLRGPEDMRDYQIEKAVPFLIENPFSALFVDVGMGKSIISLTAILHTILHEEIDHWLVVGPKRVVNETWPTEIMEWRHTAPLTYVHIRAEEVIDAVNESGRRERDLIREELLWQGIPQDRIKDSLASEANKHRIAIARRKTARRALKKHFDENPACIHLISRDHVEFLVDAWASKWPYKGIIWDESDSLKDYKTKRFKAIKRIRPLLKRFHQLTATPCAETYMHLFAQIFLLDQGDRFGRSIGAFRSEYFTHNQYTREYKLRPGAEAQIAEKIAGITLTLKDKDYLDLEEPNCLYDKVSLSQSQMDLYKTLEAEYVVTLPDGTEIEAETAAAVYQKLLQLASGVLYDTVLDEQPDGSFKKRRVVHHIHDHKIDALQTLHEELNGEPVIVAYWHQSTLERLKAAFPKAVEMDADGACVKDWNKRKIPMLLMHPAGSAYGLNMQHGGRHIVFFDMFPSLTLYLQLIGRLAGARQLARKPEERVTFLHHLVAKGTIDEAVIAAWKEKRDGQELLFNLLKKIRARITRKNKQKVGTVEIEVM